VFVNRSVVERLRQQFFTGCVIVTSTILYRFSPNFACGSEMWSLRSLLFERQTGSSVPILEMRGCDFGSFQPSGSRDHIFQQISIKSCTDKIRQCRLCIQWWM